MTDERNEKKKSAEVSAEISYTNEQTVETGIVSDVRCIDDSHYNVSGKIYNIGDEMIESGGGRAYYLFNNEGEFEEKVNFNIFHKYVVERTPFGESAKPISLEELRTLYNEGMSASSLYGNLINFFNDKKDNPDEFRNYISYFMSEAHTLYDKKQDHKDFGDTGAETLEIILNNPPGEQLPGFVCIEIHELGMRILHDCGIKAVTLSGRAALGEGHATLLYQLSDGKYVHVDYGKSVIIEADNIKDAVLALSKTNKGLSSEGYIGFIDDNCSYQEFDLKDEAVWGEELDKRDYNNKSLFNREMAGQNSVNAKVNYSNLGSISAEAQGTLAFDKSNKSYELDFALGYKKSGETKLFNESESVGAKLQYKFLKKKGDVKSFFDIKAVTDMTKGIKYIPPTNIERLNVITKADKGMYDNFKEAEEQLRAYYTKRGFDEETIDYFVNEKLESMNNDLYGTPEAIPETSEDENMQTEIPVQKYETNIFTTFLRCEAGKEAALLNDKNMSLTNVSQLSLTGGMSIDKTNQGSGLNGDVRLALESGFQLHNNLGNVSLTNDISGGFVGDLRARGGDCTPGVQLGTKLNAASNIEAKPNNNTVFGANVQGFAVITQPSLDYGVGGSIYAGYQPKNSDVTLFGNISLNNVKQQLTIGGFNERTENETTFCATVGARNKKGALSLNYNGRFDKLNPTKNRSIVSLNANINL